MSSAKLITLDNIELTRFFLDTNGFLMLVSLKGNFFPRCIGLD